MANVKEWVQAKDLNVTQMDGITFDITKDGNNISSIEITDKYSTKMRVTIAQYGYGLALMVPSPPKMKSVYRLEGKILKLAIKEDFETSAEAYDKKHYYENNLTHLNSEECDLAVNVTEVEDK